MQRRGINKRLPFAEAENGQKDRNKEGVEEEREAATERGINKRGRGKRERTGKSRRRLGAVATAEAQAEAEAEAEAATGPAVQFLAAWSTNVLPIYYFCGVRPSSH